MRPERDSAAACDEILATTGTVSGGFSGEEGAGIGCSMTFLLHHFLCQ